MSSDSTSAEAMPPQTFYPSLLQLILYLREKPYWRTTIGNTLSHGNVPRNFEIEDDILEELNPTTHPNLEPDQKRAKVLACFTKNGISFMPEDEFKSSFPQLLRKVLARLGPVLQKNPQRSKDELAEQLFFPRAAVDKVVNPLVLQADITDETAQDIFEGLVSFMSQSTQAKTPEQHVMIEALNVAMQQDFKGWSAHSLLTFIERCQKEWMQHIYYGKFFSVCNSSGTGKTKTILQLAELGVALVYINLRPSTDQPNSPPRDEAIATLFERALEECSDRNTFQERVLCIFCALLSVLKDEFASLSVKCAASGKDVIAAWNEKHKHPEKGKQDQQEREDFFDKVKTKNDELWAEENRAQTTPKQDDHSTTFEKLVEKLKIQQQEKTQSIVQWDLKVKSCYRQIQSLSCFEESKDFLVIALDEVQSLTDHLKRKRKEVKNGAGNGSQREEENLTFETLTDYLKATSEEVQDREENLKRKREEVQTLPYLPSHILGRAFSAIKEQSWHLPLWFIVTSTNTRLVDFAAPAHIHASSRVSVGGAKLFPPFSCLEWDIFLDRREDLNPRDVGTYDQTIRMGRPLWYALRNVHERAQNMQGYAMQKLTLNAQQPDAEAALLAALSQRFALEPVMGNRQAQSLVEGGVASHMRYVLETTPDREWQVTGYPSEPVMSDAAAKYLALNGNLGHAITALSTNIGNGVIHAGDYGELFSRLLLLISRDHTTQRIYLEKGDLNPNYFPYLRPVRVLDFLDTLFGPNWYDDGVPINNSEAKQTICNEFRHAWISASHWVSMTGPLKARPGTLTPHDYLRNLYTAGIGLQCSHNQPRIDKVLPIAFLTADGEAIGYSAIYIQDKNTEKSNHGSITSIFPSYKDIDLDTGHSYIAILFDFGNESHGISCHKTIETAGGRAKRNASTNFVSIYARGLAGEVFPLLKEPTFNRLLEIRQVSLPKVEDRFTERIKKSATFATTADNADTLPVLTQVDQNLGPGGMDVDQAPPPGPSSGERNPKRKHSQV